MVILGSSCITICLKINSIQGRNIFRLFFIVCVFSIPISVCNTEAILISSGAWFGILAKLSAANWNCSSSGNSEIWTMASIIPEVSFSCVAPTYKSRLSCVILVTRWNLEANVLDSKPCTVTWLTVRAACDLQHSASRHFDVRSSKTKWPPFCWQWTFSLCFYFNEKHCLSIWTSQKVVDKGPI